MRILHLDSEKTWRGGQNQTKLLIEGLNLNPFACQNFLAAPEDGPLFHSLQNQIQCLPLHLRSGLDLSAARKIGAFCREHLIDIIDAQSSKAHNLAMLAQRNSPDTKIVVHRRVDYKPRAHPLNWYKYFSKRISSYVAISQAIAEVMISFGVKREKIHVVHSAATPIEFRFSNKLSARKHIADLESLDFNRIWIGNASALSEQKDYPTFLRALSRLKKKNVSFHALIAGKGDEEKALKKLAKELALGSDDLRFLGFRDDVSDILQALDILAVSSKMEGLGTIILDALQASCCVVATRVGGVPEMIRHGETGLLVPAGDDDQFAIQLERAMTHEGFRHLLASAGRNLVEQEFSAEKMVEGNFRVYNQVLGTVP